MKCLRSGAALGVLAAVSSLFIADVSNAQSTAGAQSLLITPGARADGMGRAYIALADDPTSVWWNPGGLAFTSLRSASLMHTKLVPGLADDVYYDYLGYSQPLEGVGGFGANIIYLSYGKSVAVGDDEVERGTFTSYEVSGTLSLGFQVTPDIGVGAALKGVYVNLAPAWATEDGRAGKGSSFAVDVGGLYKLPKPFFATDQLNVAAVLTNLGPDIAFIDEGQSSPLGRILKLGFMYQVFNTDVYALRFSYDFNQPLIVSGKEEPIQNYGAEVVYQPAESTILAAARFGYIFDPDGTIEDMTFGLGFGISSIKVDWAMVPQSQFLDDNVHKFSVTAKF